MTADPTVDPSSRPSPGEAVGATTNTDLEDDGPPRLVGGFAADDHWADASHGGGQASSGAPGAERDGSAGELLVRVRHGSLEHAPFRVVAGHFQGLPLSGAEARLNERTDGRLERLLLMNLYPQSLGDLVLLEPVDDAPPRGVVIVGLGPSGELSALQLRGAMTRALLRVALEELDRRVLQEAPAGGWPTLGASAVLIGSSAGGGLTVEASVRALIEAVLAANLRIGRLPLPGGGPSRSGRPVRRAIEVVRYEILELIERYEDRVDLIVGVLAEMDRLERGELGSREPSQQVRYDLRPVRGEGRSSANSPIDAADEVWRRLDIRSQRDPDGRLGSLEFTSIGRLARAERLLGRAESNLIEPLIADAISREADPDVSGTLYELLVPPPLKGELGSGEHLQLLVDEGTADLPWELLSPRPEDQEQKVPLALRVGVLRQFRETEGLRFGVRRASGDRALVVGNPPTAGAYGPLYGAVRESVEVARRLRAAAWDVTSLIWDGDQRVVDTDGHAGGRDPASTASPASTAPTGLESRPLRVLHELMNGDWRVVHLAAHGAFGEDPATNGVVVGDLHLTAEVFSRLSIVPDLVMINACHLGRVRDPASGAGGVLVGANRAAAGVGRALLRLGTRAVVVAGWAVNDAAARAFAETLYGALVDGADFGAAVAGARRDAFEHAPQSLTWGAYQCYGDPGFRLASRRRRAPSRAARTAGELRRRILRLRASAGDQGRSAGSDSRAAGRQVREELAELETAAVELGELEMLADVADVWAELLELDRAIALYLRAVREGGSEVRLGAVEQLGNLLVRQAQRRWLADGIDPAPMIEQSRTWLLRALRIGVNPDRLALLGSFSKKRATLTSDPGRRTAHLLRAIWWYEAARTHQHRDYFALNVAQLGQLCHLLDLDLTTVSRADLDLEEVGLTTGELDGIAAAWPPATWGPPGRDGGGGEGAGGEGGSSEGNGEGDGSTAAAGAGPVEAEDFWARSVRGDRALAALFATATTTSAGGAELEAILRPDAERMVAAYRSAFELRSSAKERASVVDHLFDLAELAPPGPLTTTLLDAHRRLRAWEPVGPTDPDRHDGAGRHDGAAPDDAGKDG